mmetsp:Transcript_29836/g.44095  ORF Transcript_29836/g.44095 Transcript_29836/m.44095 type:complete len:228 (+) Transcript_29836:195-878(+)
MRSLGVTDSSCCEYVNRAAAVWSIPRQCGAPSPRKRDGSTVRSFMALHMIVVAVLDDCSSIMASNEQMAMAEMTMPAASRMRLEGVSAVVKLEESNSSSTCSMSGTVPSSSMNVTASSVSGGLALVISPTAMAMAASDSIAACFSAMGRSLRTRLRREGKHGPLANAKAASREAPKSSSSSAALPPPRLLGSYPSSRVAVPRASSSNGMTNDAQKSHPMRATEFSAL